MLSLIQDVRPLLQTQRFGRAWRGEERLASTNTAAAAWAAAGAPEGAVVVAEYQTAGRGRLGRTWQARAGQNLTFSLVLRPPLPPERLGLLTLAASVAVAEAVEPFVASLPVRIKWPNDLLLAGRKCCGMLLETSLSGASTVPIVILGIGLNVNQDKFPPELAAKATSLHLEKGQLVPRAPLFAALLLHLERRYDALLQDGEDVLSKAYERRLYGLGQPLALRLTDTAAPIQGRLLGVTETGALRLETDAGLRLFHAGEVTSEAI